MALSKEQIAGLSDALIEATSTATPMTNVVDQYPDITINEAYEVQMQSYRTRMKNGDPVVGRKVGLSARKMQEKYNVNEPFDFVFHGGSGSLLSEIREALDYGVVKMNVDTDTQYAFTQPIVDHMFKNYDGVLKVDGDVGNKKVYDPRSYGKSAEGGMAARVVEACEDLRSAGTKIS